MAVQKPRKVVEKMLSRLGYLITAHTSSVEALRNFRSSPDTFDLVITDMTMPHITGDKLANMVKEIRPDIPVILCTGYSEKISGNEDVMMIDGFLMKPVEKVKWAITIRNVLNYAQEKL